MTQSAIVSRILGEGYAQVDVERISACGKSCASCGGGCAEKQIISVRARNAAMARPGDRVVIESSTGGILGAAMLVYMVPILFFFLAYMVTALNRLPEVPAILISLAAFLLGAACVCLFNKYGRKDREIEYTITTVVNDLCSDM